MYYKNLSTEQVKRRQERFGNNSLPEEKPRSAWLIFFSQFVNPLVYVLLAVGLISLLMGKYNEIWFILVVVLLNALMGFFEENKTEKTLAALKNLVHPMARVMRDNVRRKINASELVPGDIVYLGAGEKVPADGELLEVSSLFINEAILTGESEAVKKEIGGEIFMGTIVVNGHAVMKVRTIGAATKIGSIAQDLGETKEPPTTLRVRLEKLTRTLIYISVGLSAVVFVFGVLAKRNPWEMLELAAVLLVAVIPEALLIVVTLVLVLAMRDSLKRKALIRRIFSVETLGSVTTICTDKTGTLTEGKMRVVELDLVNSLMAKKAMNLCNNLGDSVEVALWEHLEKKEKIKPQKISDDFRRTAEITFDSKHKFMAVAVSNEKIEKEHLILVKGAPEVVLKMTNLKEAERKQIIKQVDNWAEKGLKVLALASKKINKSKTEFTGKELVGLSWNGLVGLWDPPRKSVKRALKRAQRAGMKVKVVTGDYHRTAEKIMNFLDISPKKKRF
ncbi:MAG TPA: HAD-IC family P-type ATPase [Candidatus Moranbacteria bacterium]|nr:HAD-IC family P-type ATPase [Candidatus Moranbacteria bacterium]